MKPIIKPGNTIEPWFEEYYSKEIDTWEYLFIIIKKIRKFKSENNLSQRTYVNVTLPMCDILRLSPFFIDFIGSQGIVNLKTGKFKIEISEWQNNEN